jgi:hypothetical protein
MKTVLPIINKSILSPDRLELTMCKCRSYQDVENRHCVCMSFSPTGVTQMQTTLNASYQSLKETKQQNVVFTCSLPYQFQT